MRGYLRLVLGEMVPITLVFGVILFMTTFTESFSENFVLPGGDLSEELLVKWWLAGLVLGVLNTVWDEACSTLDYARHRGLAFERQACGLHLASVPCLVLLVGVPLALWLGLKFLQSDDFAIAEWGRLRALLVLGSVSLAAYGVGAWFAGLRVGAPARVLVGIGASAVVLGLARHLARPSPGEWSASPLAFVAVQLGIWAAFLLVAQRSASLGRDLDRPLPGGTSVLHGLLAALLFSLFVGELVRGVERRQQMTLAASYPLVVVHDDGRELALLSNHVPGVEGFARVGADHAPLGEAREPYREPYEVLFSPWRHWVRAKKPVWEREAAQGERYVDDDGFPFEGPWEELVEPRDGGRAFLDRSDGRVKVYYPAGDLRLEPKRIVFDEPRFTRATRVFGEEEGPAFLVGPGAWSFTMEGGEARLEPASAPEPARPEGPHLAIDDPIEYRVRVELDGASHVVHFAPRTRAERRAARTMQLVSLLRPPLFLAASHVRALPREEWARLTFARSGVLDPLYFGGKRRAYLALALALAAACGAAAAARLRALGAGPLRAVGWFAIAFGFGVSGLLLSLALETRRAWRWQRAEVFERAPLPRIVSFRS